MGRKHKTHTLLLIISFTRTTIVHQVPGTLCSTGIPIIAHVVAELTCSSTILYRVHGKHVVLCPVCLKRMNVFLLPRHNKQKRSYDARFRFSHGNKMQHIYHLIRGATLAQVQYLLLLLFLTFSALVANPKKLLYTVANYKIINSASLERHKHVCTLFFAFYKMHTRGSSNFPFFRVVLKIKCGCSGDYNKYYSGVERFQSDTMMPMWLTSP